jgi:hypothetical protein
MSTAQGETGVEKDLQHHAEQRSNRRYDLQLKIEYVVIKNGRIERGNGRTLNISSRGVLFKTKRALPPQGPIELLLNWPVLLEGNCPLRLVLWGRIVRNDGRGIAIRFTGHEFRTVGKRQSSAQHPSEERIGGLNG